MTHNTSLTHHSSYLFKAFAVFALVARYGPVDAQDLPESLSHFKQVESDPVFTGAAGCWDALIRERGWILKDNDKFRLWYTGYNPEESLVTMKLGYATSEDGITWTRFSDRPIFEECWIEDMMIVPHEGTLYMFAEGADDQSQLLTSTDGLNWKRVGTLDVRLANGSPIPPGPFGTPTAFFEDGMWHLFYERRDAGIWHATSVDMKVWTNLSDTPVIVPGPESYDGLMIAMNQIIKTDKTYVAVMHGTGSPSKPRDWCTYFAVSNDLSVWTKATAGPVFPVKDNKSSGVLVPDGTGFRMYTMHGKIDLHR